MAVLIKVKGVPGLVSRLRSLPDQVTAGVKITGPAVAYWAVWEWGSARLKKPGPKTVWSTNPAGERAILTLTAPHGYIRVNRQAYIDFIRVGVKHMQLGRLPIRSWLKAIKFELFAVAGNCADLIRQTAPYDTGQLSSGIKPVKPGDPLLTEDSTSSLELGNF